MNNHVNFDQYSRQHFQEIIFYFYKKVILPDLESFITTTRIKLILVG